MIMEIWFFIFIFSSVYIAGMGLRHLVRNFRKRQEEGFIMPNTAPSPGKIESCFPKCVRGIPPGQPMWRWNR